MKFKTTRAPLMGTTGKAPEYVVRSDREIASLVARYKPLANAHAQAKAATKFAATEIGVMLASLKASLAAMAAPAPANAAAPAVKTPAKAKTRHVVSIPGRASYEK